MISHRLDRNICKRHTDKGLLSKIDKELLKPNNKKQPNLKNESKTLTDISLKRYTDGKKA